MPSETPKMARLMAAVAHGWHKPGGGGPSVEVAKEFNAADKGTGILSKGSHPQDAHYAQGGAVLPRSGDWKKTVPNRGFLDSPDRFTGGRKPADYPREKKTEEDWKKSGGPRGDLKPQDKSERPVKPRS